MKKLLSVFILLTILLLTGCSSRPKEGAPLPPLSTMPATAAPTTLPETTPQTEPTEESIAPTYEVVTVLVDDAFAKSYNHGADVIAYHIPQINLPGQTIQQINQEIYDTLKKSVDYSAEELSLNGYPASWGISYQWAVNGDILSLMVCDRLSSEYGGTQYYAYNVSISSCAHADRATLIATAGLTESQFLTLSKTALEKDFRASLDMNNITDAYLLNFARELLAKTISDENIQAAKLYLNQHAQLCIAWRAYSVAGADYYWHHTVLETEHLVKILRADFPVFDGPSYDNFPVGTVEAVGTYTIVAETFDPEGNLWGKLKSGAGWVDLTCVEKEALDMPPVTVAKASESLLNGGNYHYCQADVSTDAYCIAISAHEPLRDVSFFSIDAVDSYKRGPELFHISQWESSKPLVVSVSFPGASALYGLEFTDQYGNTQTYTLSESGRNGSIVITPYIP